MAENSKRSKNIGLTISLVHKATRVDKSLSVLENNQKPVAISSPALSRNFGGRSVEGNIQEPIIFLLNKVKHFSTI